MRAWLDGYDSKKKSLESNEEEYLTEEQYDYARKTGDGESGKIFHHSQIINEKKKSITHELKILPVYFEAVANGRKQFEIRKNDRDFQIGD
jgi:hypothetical protein